MKAAQYLLGPSQEKTIELQMPSGAKVPALLRAISDIEDARAIAYGVQFAKEHGVEGAGHGHPLFDKGLRAYTLYLATLDVDSPKDNRQRFFETPEDLSKFHPDWVLWLAKHWEAHQLAVSPLRRMESTEDLFKACQELAKDGDDFSFFLGLAPYTAAVLARFTAGHALNSPELKSLLTPASETKD